MRKVSLDGRCLWAVRQRRMLTFRKKGALRAFARFWFHALGGEWIAARLVFDADWEARSLPDVIEEIARAMERDAATDEDWRLTYTSPSMSKSTAYYAGDAPFSPTAIWRGEDLKEDLRQDQEWHVRPAARGGPLLTRTRVFIEVFPWTDDEDVRRAFRQMRQFQDDSLPRSPRDVKALLGNLEAYKRYTSGARMDAYERVNAYRQAQRFASLLGFPAPKRPHKLGAI